MKVAFAQLNYTIGDFEGNSEKIIAQIEKAKKRRSRPCSFLRIVGYGLLSARFAGKKRIYSKS